MHLNVAQLKTFIISISNFKAIVLLCRVQGELLIFSLMLVQVIVSS